MVIARAQAKQVGDLWRATNGEMSSAAEQSRSFKGTAIRASSYSSVCIAQGVSALGLVTSELEVVRSGLQFLVPRPCVML